MAPPLSTTNTTTATTTTHLLLVVATTTAATVAALYVLYYGHQSRKQPKNQKQSPNHGEQVVEGVVSATTIPATDADAQKNHVDLQMSLSLQKSLQDGTSLNAHERVCTVDERNIPTPHGHTRAEMRLQHLWHRATYCLIIHDHHLKPSSSQQEQQHDHDTYVLVQRRSHLKDYCPGKLDPTPGGVVGFGESYEDNVIRELQEEMGIHLSPKDNSAAASAATATTDDTASQERNQQRQEGNSFQRLFSFPYQDDRVKVWGDFYEVHYTGSFQELRLQVEEVEDVERMTLSDLSKYMNDDPDAFMPDSLYAMKLYFQHVHDVKVDRKLLPGYSSSDLDSYQLRPKPLALFFDCDDTLYFDEWQTANILTAKIEEWCVQHHGLPPGRAYELYQTHGTALRGLLAEGYLESTPQAIQDFLQNVHDIPISQLLSRDDNLRDMLLRMDPSIPKYIFTASVRDHAQRCLQALGIDDLFVDIIDVQSCHLETKHSTHSFEMAMKIAGITNDSSSDDDGNAAAAERCILLDDNLKNIRAARSRGWRSVLVGRVSRDSKQPISSEHAELEIERIHDLPTVLPELFVTTTPDAAVDCPSYTA